jgi:hypothetical protein
MAFLDDMATFIAAGSTAFTVYPSAGANLFKSHMPPEPDTCTTVYEQTGSSPTWTFSSTAPTYEHPRLQVIARSTSYQTARANAELIYRMLDRQVINSAPTTSAPVYLQITAAHTPADAGTDANERDLVTCNFDVWKRRS